MTSICSPKCTHFINKCGIFHFSLRDHSFRANASIALHCLLCFVVLCVASPIYPCHLANKETNKLNTQPTNRISIHFPSLTWRFCYRTNFLTFIFDNYTASISVESEFSTHTTPPILHVHTTFSQFFIVALLNDYSAWRHMICWHNKPNGNGYSIHSFSFFLRKDINHLWPSRWIERQFSIVLSCACILTAVRREFCCFFFSREFVQRNR